MAAHQDDLMAAQLVWNKWRHILVTEENTTKMLTEIVEAVAANALIQEAAWWQKQPPRQSITPPIISDILIKHARDITTKEGNDGAQTASRSSPPGAP